jgi:hypothetical protein
MSSPEGIYDGNWQNDEKNGSGVMIFSNQDEYHGMWKNGLRDG